MDPFTAGFIAVLVTYAVTSSGARDMAAIAKGQTPPGHAERMAKIAQQQATSGGSAAAGGAPGGYSLPAAAEPRRIRIKDLARHWWEDALEDADHWRATRRLSRPDRKAARKAWRTHKANRLKNGYELLKQRGQRRFSDQDHQEPTSDGEDAEVVDLEEHRRTRDQEPAPEGAGSADSAGDDRPEPPSMEGEDMSETSETSLSDGQTYAAHQQAFDEYIRYYRECAERQETVADRLEANNAEGDQIAKARQAATAYNEVADKAEAAKTKHAQTHQGIYEQRQAHTEAAEGGYLKNR